MRKQKKIQKLSQCGGNAGAYLTIYLTLVMALLLSLFLVMVEGVRKNSFYLQAECITDIALNSCLAEYHQELFRQYGLFAIDSSYGTEIAAIENTQQHFLEYVEGNLRTDDIFLNFLFYRNFVQQQIETQKITKVRFFTDGNGEVFRRRAAEAVWDESLMGKAQQLLDWMKVVEDNQLMERDVAEEKREWDEKLQTYAKKNETTIEGFSGEPAAFRITNPTDFLEKKRKEGILKWVIADADQLSDNKIETRFLAGRRIRQKNVLKGNFDMDHGTKGEIFAEKVLFQEYLMKYMGHYGKESDQDCLQYQLEYLVTGCESDLDNLRKVTNLLLAFREAANITYLNTDAEKKAAAEILATAIASLLEIPEAAEVLTIILLYGWAFAESLYDVKCLLTGKKIPLMKDKESWHYDLETALGVDIPDDGGCDEGLSYEDYLRIFMFVQKEEILTQRTMDMVEADIRMTSGNELFRLDGCVDAVEVSADYHSRFGYDCNVTRQKGYRTQ